MPAVKSALGGTLIAAFVQPDCEIERSSIFEAEWTAVVRAIDAAFISAFVSTNQRPHWRPHQSALVSTN